MCMYCISSLADLQLTIKEKHSSDEIQTFVQA